MIKLKKIKNTKPLKNCFWKIGKEPSYDKPEGDKVYDTIMKILEQKKLLDAQNIY